MSDCTLDCKGLPCPQPVLKCKNAIDADAPQTLSIIVDNQAARENVGRYLGTRGYKVEVTEDTGGLFVLKAQADETLAAQASTPASKTDEAPKKTVVFITSSTVGTGDDALGSKLMLSFLSTLLELDDELWRVVLVNGGVKLAIEGSEYLPKLQKIAETGATILVCGTCLDHFGLLEKKQVGETTNMMDVVTSLQLADKVIQI
ncbi:MAG: sulfurtransferase-like selenium metabolism protein YedF [Desulfovibrio sp.]|uniref:sulfurtransferase-like selenium metabolism protein YedF n=1 Tax=Desulfovibrio sp. 7SRBS1 TaxID=3378064 RepID=UPI003B414AEE